MDINRFLLQLAICITVIFGGTFLLRALWKGEYLLDQLIMCVLGIVLGLGTLFWRKVKM